MAAPNHVDSYTDSGSAFGLLEIILLPAKGSTHPGSAPIATVVVLFVAFGAASIGFAGYWAKRKRDQTTAAHAAIAASVAGVVPDDED